MSGLTEEPVSNPCPFHEGAGLPSLAFVSMVGEETVVLAAAMDTLFVEGSGFVAEVAPVKVHCASVRPHNPLPLLVEATVKLALAFVPVSLPLMKRSPVVLI